MAGIDCAEERVVQGTPFRYIDASNLKNARTIERMTLLSGEMGQRYGFFPRMNYKLLGDHSDATYTDLKKSVASLLEKSSTL